jgi:hypothetical protein
MRTETAKQLEQAARIHQEKMEQKGMAGRAKDWLNSTWLVKAVYNDYNAGIVSDARRRVVEEGFYGKTLDDTVNRQSYGDFNHQRVPGEEWMSDAQYEKWLAEKTKDQDNAKDKQHDQRQDRGNDKGMGM